MDAQTCIKKLGYVGILSFATVDEHGHPQVRSISAVHFEPNAIYFYTARGKNFCRQLLSDGHVQIHALTKYKEMIRLSAIAKPVSDDEQEHWKNVIFDEQPYLVNVYPGDTRSIGIIFVIRDAQIEYFNLGVRPIDRYYYTMGDAKPERKGFEITDAYTLRILIDKFISDPAFLKKTGKNAGDYVRSSSGTSDKILGEIGLD